MNRSSSPTHRGLRNKSFAHIVKNDKGGILITETDINIAFSVLDKHGTGRVGLHGLQDRLRAVFPSLSMDDIKFILGDEKYITKAYLENLLLDNTITQFDPVEEAFKAFDPDNTGYLDKAALKKALEKLGFDSITDEDIAILIEVAGDRAEMVANGEEEDLEEEDEDDIDNGGGGRRKGEYISLEDFRMLLEKTNERPATRAELGKPKDDDR